MLTEAAAQIGPLARPVVLDVTNRESFKTFLDITAQQSDSGLDVLINNAGIQHVAAVVDVEEADFRRQFDVNVVGTLNGLQLALATMLPRRRGHIINVASAAGRTTLAHNGVYSSTKAAIISLSEAAHIETTGSGVRISMILPGLVNTEMAAGAYQPPGLKMIAPDAVAAAIVRAIERPRFEAWVPPSTGWLYHATALLPRSSRERLMRILRIDRTLVDVDWATRRGYENRARAGVETDPRASGSHQANGPTP